MKTLLEILNMSVEEAAEELMDYAECGGTWAELESMICGHIELSPSDIEVINESMRAADYSEGIIYDDVDDIYNAEELEADYDDFDRYYIVEGSTIEGYTYHGLSVLLNNGEYYETKRYIAQKLMDEESAKQIVNLCNEMMKG